ncbi:ADP-ribose 1-phosphate phophatase related protein [Minicystis rosea]|nr:ADP-ribose 1-phosphate phophatase related protein [Minicystis rosea]
MIAFTSGNLLDADVEALVNTVNCVGVMGKGLALQFKQAYPENFRVYERACRAGEVAPGRMLTVPTGRLTGPKLIVNFPTKRHWRGASRMEDIESGLVALVDEVRRLHIRSIAMPPLGCGNGGLDWADVRPRIERALAALEGVRVVIFEPSGPPAADAMVVATKKPPMSRGRALLVALLERYALPGYEHTKLEVQKLAYFLFALGELPKLAYVKHQFGPYAENLNHVLQAMEGHYLRGYGDRSKARAEITLLPGAVEAAHATLADDAAADVAVERVARLIQGFENPHGLELLATVHWVATREDPAAAADVEQAIAGVARWNERKRERFRPEHVRKAWRRLREAGWLPQADAALNAPP